MYNAPSIPITRRHHLLSFTDFLEAEGVSVKSVGKRTGLPFWQIGAPNDWIPLRDTMSYFEEFERATNTKKLGILISEAENTVSKSAFSRFLDNSPTLFHVLRKLCVHARQHTSLASLWLSETDDNILLCRANYDQMSLGLRQHEQYVIGFFVRLIEYAAGTDWRPGTIWTSAPNQYDLRDTDTFADCEVVNGQPYTAIPVPKYLVSKAPGNFFKPSGDGAELLEEVDSLELAATTFAGSLCQILVSVLKDQHLDIAAVADILCMHPRTLQRRLQTEGSSYQAVLDEARFKIATELMMRPGASVAEAGRALGFSSASNFSRSFKRISGVTPQEYLKLHTQEE